MKKTPSSPTPRLWYIAQVPVSQEKTVRTKLTEMGYDVYLPVQTYENKSKKKVEKVLIPCMLFVRITEEERLLMLHYPFIKRFLTNKSMPSKTTGRGTHPLATFTDEQMHQLQLQMQTTPMLPFLV